MTNHCTKEMENRDAWIQKSENIIDKLEEYLEIYDSILLFHDLIPGISKMFSAFCQSEALMSTKKNILIMAVAGDARPVGGDYCQITEEEYGILHQLYRMYEFSDRIQLIDETVQYGNLENYIQTRLLTREEVFEAMLR